MKALKEAEKNGSAMPAPACPKAETKVTDLTHFPINNYLKRLLIGRG